MARPNTAAVRLLAGEREPVLVATTANISLSGLQTIDAVALAAGDRVLVKDQTDATANGIYTASTGTWYRAADARSSRAINKGVTVHVQSGTAHEGQVFAFQTLDPVIGTDDIDITFYFSDDYAEDIQNIIDAAIATTDLLLVDIIAAGSSILGSGVDAIFASKVAAQAYDPDTAPSTIILTGYYNAGDRGGALYKKVVAEPAHEGKVQITEGSWYQIAEREIDIRMLGARCDGSTDDTTAIQNADEVAAALGVDLTFPGEDVFTAINGTLVPSANAHWRGKAGEATTLYLKSTTATAIHVTEGNFTLENMRLLPDAAVTRTSTAIGVHLDNASVNIIKNVRPYNTGVPFRIDVPAPGSFLIDGCATSGTVASGVDFDVYNSFFGTISHTSASGNPAARAFAHVVLRNVEGQIQFIDTNMFQAGLGIAMIPGNGETITLVKCSMAYFDNNPNGPLRILPTGTGTVERVTFLNGWLTSASAADTTEGIVISGNGSNVTEITIADSELFVSASASLLAEGVKNLVLARNNIINFKTGGDAITLDDVASAEVAGNKFLQVDNVALNLTGTTTKARVYSNNFQTVGTAIINTASGNQNRIRDNPGYNPVGASAPAAPASGGTYTAGASPETVYLSASGGVSALVHNVTSILPAALGNNIVMTIHLDPNESFVPTYGGTLTLKKMVH